MANNINKVWELMGINPETGTGTYKNRMGLGNAITRDNGIPLDLSSLHATYNDAVVYAATSSIAYVDQVVAAEGVVYIITAESQGKVTIDTYKDSITGKIIEGEAKEYDVFLKPVGTIPGFDAAENGTLPQIQIGADGKRTLTWVPISAIVEGDGNTVTEVKGAANDSHVTVTPEYDQANDKYTYTISVNVEDKADAEQVADDIAAAKEEIEGSIDSAVQTLEGKITEAKSEAKTYTDEEIEGLSVVIEQKEGVEYIIVKNKAGEEVASANASKFVQDSFLNDVAYDAASGKITFTWTMGDGSSKTDEVAVADFVQTYTAGTGLTLNGNEFGVNTDVIATKGDIENINEVLATKFDSTQVDAAIDAKLVVVEATYATKTELAPVTQTANNASTAVANLETRFDEIVAVGGEPNAINKIQVNGEELSITNKTVNIPVPVMGEVKVSDLKDGGAVLQDVADLKTGVAGNADNITLINQKLNAEQLGLAALNTRLSSLETEVGVVESSRIDALEGVVGDAEAGLVKVVASHTADLITLGTKDTELAAAIEANGKLIAANTAKFADYRTVADSYSKAEVEDLIDGVVGQIDYSPYALKTEVASTVAELTTAINGKADAKATEDALALKANAADVYTKTEADAAFMTQDEVDSRINALIVGADPEGGKTIENIQNLVAYVDENASDIAELITTVGNNTTAIENAVAAIGDNKTAIEDLQDSVTAGLAGVAVHSSTEIEVAARSGENETGVELSIKEVNVNKLVQTTGDVLILNGGSTTV